MDLNLFLHEKEIDPATVIVMRHRPSEPPQGKVLPWLPTRAKAFSAYQQSHGLFTA